MIIKISCDDGSKQDLEVAYLMRDYELDCIFYMPVNYKDVNLYRGRQPLTQRNFEKISGWFEIGSHTVNHPLLTRIDPRAARYELEMSRKLLQDMTGQPINSLAWPRGYTNPELQQFAQEIGYKDARGVGVGYIYPSENKYDTKNTLHVGYDRKEYGGKTWYEYGLYMLEQAKDEPNAEYSIFLHSWELEKYPRGFELFELLLKQLKAAI